MQTYTYCIQMQPYDNLVASMCTGNKQDIERMLFPKDDNINYNLNCYTSCHASTIHTHIHEINIYTIHIQKLVEAHGHLGYVCLEAVHVVYAQHAQRAHQLLRLHQRRVCWCMCMCLVNGSIKQDQRIFEDTIDHIHPQHNPQVLHVSFTRISLQCASLSDIVS